MTDAKEVNDECQNPNGEWEPSLGIEVDLMQYQEGFVNFNTVINPCVRWSLNGGWKLRQGQALLDLIPQETRKEMLKRGDYWETTFPNE